MKQTFLAAFVCLSLTQLKAQTNLLTDGGFESLSVGYNSFITNSSGKAKGLSGKWQMVFAKGGCPNGCGRDTASVVNTIKNKGNNAVEIKIDTQYNRNDIRLFQSINNVPAGVYEVSCYIKADIASPLALDVLKSSQQPTNNGAVPYTGSFTATTEWQLITFTVDITDWSDDDRNEMRVSIRLNNNKALPQGPFPKTFWVDDVLFIKK
jgi:hypothetical protein